MDLQRLIPGWIARRDTLQARWHRLSANVEAFGPRDDKCRPAVLMFHGCGGVRGHLPEYGEAAARAGWRAYLIDSFTPRGWSRQFGMAFVCTASVFRGWERAGDVAAAVYGISRRKDVDPHRMVLAGWSHGGWGIMELMSAPLKSPAEIGLADVDGLDLSGVKGAFLAYPYVGAVARRRFAAWVHRPRTFAVIARHDHLTTVRNARKVMDAVEDGGVEVERWLADGTHAFDEHSESPIMHFDPALAQESIDRFTDFLRRAV